MDMDTTTQKNTPAADWTEVEGIGYKVYGDGPLTILLLRGLGRWSEHWLGFDQRLAESGYRVISVDNRGFGASSAARLPSGNGILDLAEDVAAIVSREAPEGALVIGVSLGGMIALGLAATRPQLVRGLMLVNSSVGAGTFKRISRPALMAVLTAILGVKKGYSSLAAVLLSNSATADARHNLAERWLEIDKKQRPDPWRIISQLKMARRFYGLPELLSIRCPAVVIQSTGDLFVDPANSDFIHRQIKGSILLSHPTAGHELAFEDPQWLTSQIQNFAKQLTGQNRLV